MRNAELDEVRDQNYKEAVAAEWKEIRDMEEKKTQTTANAPPPDNGELGIYTGKEAVVFEWFCDRGMQPPVTEEIEDLLSRLAAKSEWRGIDSAPKTGRRILIVIHACGAPETDCFVRIAYFNDGAWYFEDSGRSVTRYGYVITHWQLLPLPPMETK